MAIGTPASTDGANREDRREPGAAPTPDVRTTRSSFAGKLAQQMDDSRKRLAPFQRTRREANERFAGSRYGIQPSQTPRLSRPLATIKGLVTILVPHIDVSILECEFEAKDPDQQLAMSLLAAATTDALAEMGADETVSQLLQDAMFGPAISKIDWSAVPPARADYRDWRRDTGLPFWARLSFDNYLLDPRCRDRRAAAWEGDEYPIYDDDAEAGGYSMTLLRASGSADDQRRRDGADDLSDPARGGGHDPLYPEHLVADVYLYRENVVVSLPARGQAGTKFVREIEFDGPEGGPYGMFGFDYPLDNPIPTSVVEDFLDLDETQNAVVRKVQRDAEGAKTVHGYQQTAARDADALRLAPHGEFVPMADPKNVVQYVVEGARREDMETMEFLREWANRNGPNPDIMGGLAADSPTLGQDQLKASGAATRLDAMRRKAMKHLGDRVKAVAWHVWRTQADAMRMVNLRLGPGRESFAVPWRPEDRRGDLPMGRYELAFHPVGLSPQQQYAATVGLLRDILIPLAPMMQAQGLAIDVEALTSTLSRHGNLPSMREWFRRIVPMPSPMGMATGQGGQPAQRTSINLGGGQPRALGFDRVEGQAALKETA
ncbi:MAG TPA: hypothetical protein VMY35_18565 [Phycisphaerae bacterium]|nr:hypothetical protein [Phycisphaerae bacterium]